MDSSLSHWLAVREAADARARSARLTRVITEVMHRPPIRVLDLGTGAGSNIRFLAPQLPSPQHWLAVDGSATLLADLRQRTADWGSTQGYTVTSGPVRCTLHATTTNHQPPTTHLFECAIETRQVDLGRLDDSSLFVGRDLVTASALLDLVSASWLGALASHCRAARAAVLFTITYDGRSACEPREPEDARVRELLNGHQHRNKGLGGPAEGPGAADCAARVFAEAGYRVERERSDWELGAADPEVQRLLVEGWAQAAAEMVPEDGRAIAEWHARRLAHIDAGRSRIIVGHQDMAAWMPGP